MLRCLNRGHSLDKFRRGYRKLPMYEGSDRHTQSLDDSSPMGEEKGGHRPPNSKSRFCKDGDANAGGKESHYPSDMDLMKEKFAKLLLGEDMSGGGKGVSSALALSNAITNLAASVFGEQRRLEPMAPDVKARWKKEIDWLLSVTDHIVEMVPSKQTAKDGTQMEIMTTQQRNDLHMNIPALRKLDNMLLECLDSFKDRNEFWYVKRDSDESQNGNGQRNEDKWWLPVVKVPPNGLSDVTRKWLQFQKESVSQVLKASMAINAQIISEMEIPDNYIDSLPKNGRASLGDAIYRSITVEYFNPEQFLSNLDLSTEHKILDVKNRIEASVVIWKRKMVHKDGKSSWGSAISLEKREQFEERAETILVLLKHKFPGLPQSSLDISKIQYNKDVGHSVLESYSRILESLAHTVMSRIEDVMEADAVARNVESKRTSLTDSELGTGPVKFPNPEEEIQKLNNMEGPTSMTLFDFMEWEENQDPDSKKMGSENWDDVRQIFVKKPLHILPERFSDTVRSLGGLRSPRARD